MTKEMIESYCLQLLDTLLTSVDLLILCVILLLHSKWVDSSPVPLSLAVMATENKSFDFLFTLKFSVIGKRKFSYKRYKMSIMIFLETYDTV